MSVLLRPLLGSFYFSHLLEADTFVAYTPEYSVAQCYSPQLFVSLILNATNCWNFYYTLLHSTVYLYLYPHRMHVMKWRMQHSAGYNKIIEGDGAITARQLIVCLFPAALNTWYHVDCKLLSARHRNGTITSNRNGGRNTCECVYM